MSKETDKIYKEAKEYKEKLLRESGGLKKWDTMNEDTAVRVVGFRRAMDWADGMGDFEVHCRMQDSFWVAVNRYREMSKKGYDEYVVSAILGLGCVFDVRFDGIHVDDEYKELVHYDEVDVSDLEFEDMSKYRTEVF